MTIKPQIPAIAALALMPLLGGCMSAVNSSVQHSIAEARQELRTQPLSLHADGQPDAQISTRGELRIGDRPIALDAGQHEAVQAYRDTVVAVADAALEAGAKVSRDATRGMWREVLSGNEERFERRVEASADRLQRNLCPGLADIERVQSRLVGEVPEFAPYAEQMDDELRECRQERTGSNS